MGQRRGQAKQEGISVFVRVRATAAQDEGDSPQVVEVNESQTSLCVRDAQRPTKSIECAFDRVFGPESVQEDVFRSLVPALDTVIKGFNACVLAYGQTGAGKTHTLIGPGGGTGLPDDQAEWGIIPRAVQFLFDRLALAAEEDETFSYSVTCSFLQIYNENLVDLLLLQDGGAAGAAAGGAALQIREETGGGRGRGGTIAGGFRGQRQEAGGDGESLTPTAEILGVGGFHQNRASKQPSGGKASENRRVFVNGLSSSRVGGAQDVLRYVNLGAANRRVRATQHNEASSRSHAVMQLTVDVKSGGGGEEAGGGGGGGIGKNGHVTYRQAKLSLVDLAGSEKMDAGLRISKGHFKELRSINQSLSTLGNVVSALSEKGRTHVPYRDSKLTRLLQDSLGGNTRTTIIACVNPAEGQVHETINTLQFADRAKKVMVRLRANEVVDDRVLLARAQAEIKRLKRRLREALEGTLLAAGEDRDDGDSNADEVNSGGCHHPEGGRGSGEAAKTRNGALGGCSGESGGDRAKGGERGAENAEIAAAGANLASHPYDAPAAKEAAEKTAVIPAAAAPAVDSTHRRQTAKLIAENERLREDNDRLRADVQRLVIQSNKQRLRRQRRQQRSVGRAGGTVPTGPPSAPIDWSSRYAEAAADARRRRPESSHRTSSSYVRMNRSAPSSRTETVARKNRASPMTAPGRVPNLPRFFRRQFGADGDAGEGAGSEGEPVEDGLSAEEVRAIIGENGEAGATKTRLALPNDPEEEDEEAVAAKQLVMFRRELEGGAVGGSFAPLGEGGGVGGGGEEKRAGAAPRNNGAGSGHQDEETDIELFLEKSQRLEDLMFEAHGRERRRLREERANLASAREQRLGLEAQLAELTAGASIADGTDTGTHTPTNISTVKPAATSNKNHAPQPRVNSAALSTSADEESRGQPASSKGWNHLPQQKQQQSPPPSFDGAISASNKSRTTTRSSTNLGVAGRDKINSSHHRNYCGDREKRIGWAEQPSTSTTDATTRVATASASTSSIPATTATTTAMMMAVLAPPEQPGGSGTGSGAPSSDKRGSHYSNNPALGARRTVPASRLPHDRRRQQPGRVFPAAIPDSLPSSTQSAGSRQRRPATSTGGTPTGSNRVRSRSRSRRTQLRAGRVSRSPVRGGRLAFLGPSSPQHEQNKGGRGGVGHAPKRGLTYGVADLGLRLKVYSFRYDHHYECQVVGYDSRRRMHRCAYDATGEKQWHDLANKRFEVVGQNGAVVRSSESAPPAPALAPARPSANNRASTPPLLLLPTSPDTMTLDTAIGGTGGGGGGGGR